MKWLKLASVIVGLLIGCGTVAGASYHLAVKSLSNAFVTHHDFDLAYAKTEIRRADELETIDRRLVTIENRLEAIYYHLLERTK